MDHVLTEVSADVDPAREPDLISQFHELVAKPVPDGLIRTELLRGPGGRWRVQTLWRDRDALLAMRAAAQPPAAPELFRSVGAVPSLLIYDVVAEHTPDRRVDTEPR